MMKIFFLKREIRKWVLISAPGILILAMAGILVSRFVPTPPVKLIDQAWRAISLARAGRAELYSGQLFREATMYYDSAMIHWKKVNDDYIFSRDYSIVAKYAGIAEFKAKMAYEDAIAGSSTLETKTGDKIKTLGSLVGIITQRFNDYPLTPEIRNRISKGKFLLKESEIAYKKGSFIQADRKLTESEYLLTTSYEFANENLKRYFRSYPDWKQWVDSTIAESRNNGDYTIIVDKFSRKVYVYLNGDRQCEYSAELGKNWVGHKRVKGDKATPEGIYKITRKFKSDSTKYYKALLLNYPNDQDTAHFEAAKAKGILPPTAKIGGMIEIHGNGGKGNDWTEGCIALTDKEMDSLFKVAEIGTTVTIVGSMHDLNHVLRR